MPYPRPSMYMSKQARARRAAALRAARARALALRRQAFTPVSRLRYRYASKFKRRY